MPQHGIKCPCMSCCNRFEAQGMSWDNDKRRYVNPSSSWGSRTVGSIAGNDVTFREGQGDKQGHTLIADGQASGRAFDQRREHNHYGPKAEGGRIEDDGGDRGYYTGPDQ